MLVKGLIILTVVVLVLNLFAFMRKRRDKREVEVLFEKIYRRLGLEKKDRSKSEKKLMDKIHSAGLHMSIHDYKNIRLILTMFFVFGYVIISYINKVNMYVYLDRIEAIGKLIGNPDFANLDWTLNVQALAVVTLLGFFSLDIAIKVLSMFRSSMAAKEVLLLQSYAVIMLKAGLSTKQIVTSLYERAKIFKEPLEKAAGRFSVDPERALEELKYDTSNKDFAKIVHSLNQNLNNNSDLSLEYLQSHRRLGKELKKMLRKERNQKANKLGILFMIIPLLVLVMVGGYPWFIYAIKQMGNIPI